MQTWQLQEAKAKFSTLMRAARTAPQVVTVRGEEEAVVVSKREYDRMTGKKEMSLGEFFDRSPLKGLDIEFERDKSLPRHIDLGE